MNPGSDITDLDADALSAAIHARQLSCREVMQAYLVRIHRLNPVFNAIVNLAPDDVLLAQADRCDAELARGNSRGWLHGIPQAIKDTGHAIGFPTTYGSPLLKDAVATQDSLMTARMKAAGCIVIGKTNMPELGLGSHTYNRLFGATRAGDVQWWDVRSHRMVGDEIAAFAGATDVIGSGQDAAYPAYDQLLHFIAVPTEEGIRQWNFDVTTWPTIACRRAGTVPTRPSSDCGPPAGEPYHVTCPEYPAG